MSARKYRFTVFTPTYNRAYIIDNLYRSLENQTYRNFEWLIIDQGTDDTENKIETYMQLNTIPSIIYVKSPTRKGINRSINDALSIANGELFFKVDDDDFLTEDALELLDYYEKTIEEKSKYAGVSGLRGYHDGRVIGSEWKHDRDYIDATGLERMKFHLNGDKAEAYYLDVLKKYGPLPEFDGETFTFESFLYDDIAYAGLKIRWFNKIIYYTEYLPDGQTANSHKNLCNNLKTYACYINKMIKYHSGSHIRILKSICRYFEMCKEKKIGFKEASQNINYYKTLIYIYWVLSYLTKYIKLPKG